MNANAFDTMIVPVIRGIFLAAMLGGAAVGLARMVGAIVACLWPPQGRAVPERTPRQAPEVIEDEFAPAGA